MMIVTAVALSALLLSTPARSTEASASEMQSGRAYTTYAVAPQERNGAYRDRAKFASAFRKVEEGMTKAAVKRLLGRPDVVASAPSAEPYQSRWQAEQWRYGAKDAGSFAALGSIWFSDVGATGTCLPRVYRARRRYVRSCRRSTMRQTRCSTSEGSAIRSRRSVR
jgi:hypothetical protein